MIWKWNLVQYLEYSIETEKISLQMQGTQNVGGKYWIQCLQQLDWCPDWCSVLHTNLWFQKHLVRQLWQPDGCRRTEGRLSTTLAAKGCVLSTQQERSFKWIDLSEWWWEKKHGESLFATIGTWRYPIRTYKSLGAISMMFPGCKAPRSHSSLFQKFSCTLYYSQA